MGKITIAIVDDDILVSQLLEKFLLSFEKYDVLFIASDGQELIDKLKLPGVEVPEIILLDLKMKKVNGIETMNYLKTDFPAIKVIIVSSYYQHSFMGFLLKTGASAFVPKEVSPHYLMNVINVVYNHGVYFTEDQLESVREQVSSKSPKPFLKDEHTLSQREIDVLKLICMQKTAKEIGEKLFIAAKTVEGHKNNLFLKTEAKNIAGLVIYAIQNKILNLDELSNTSNF